MFDWYHAVERLPERSVFEQASIPQYCTITFKRFESKISNLLGHSQTADITKNEYFNIIDSTDWPTEHTYIMMSLSCPQLTI